MLEIRPARPEDLDAVWPLVRRAVAGMRALGNPQWGEDYPTRADYEGDIARGELFAAFDGETLAGVTCINTAEAPEYDPLPWTTHRPAVVIHRMAVDPQLQHRGVGRAFFTFAQKLALDRGVTALRIDTYCENHRMQQLIRKMGYTPVGEVRFRSRSGPFYCFEKQLNGEESLAF